MPIYLSRFIGRSFCGFNALTLNRLSFFFLSTTTHNWGVLSYSVAHKGWLVSDHPVCRSRVGFADFLLMRQPPLLTRRGLRLRKYCVAIPSLLQSQLLPSDFQFRISDLRSSRLSAQPHLTSDINEAPACQ